MQEGAEVGEAVSDGEGASHPFEGGVVVAIGINGGGPIEDVEVIVGEIGVVVELGFEEAKEVLGSEGRVEMGLEEAEKLVVVRLWGVEESECW